ncbi:hypothetical protein SEVIR_8G067300v4 [Setaria viridis]|uniref:Uncharacterized protein n=1 Tax=Setaria viridis TaxID=4556 RepID=A0A4U6TCJ1_SETVI|nr:hypothetical protein SEVIR_8G067300v2 [Setaria viridis]TKV99798.1 hypothetical protein SEVIR_8G067300v2 [Setaria viridis]
MSTGCSKCVCSMRPWPANGAERRAPVADPPLHHRQMRVMGRTAPLAQLARVTRGYPRGEPPKLLHTYVTACCAAHPRHRCIPRARTKLASKSNVLPDQMIEQLVQELLINYKASS